MEILDEHGVSTHVVRYLEQPPDADVLLEIARLLDQPVRAMLREHEAEFVADREKLDLDDDGQLARWLAQHPQALQRPIVVDVAAGRAVIGRPPENVMQLLPR